MSPEFDNAGKRFEEEMQAVDDVVHVLAKGHLLIEEALTRVIELHLVHPEYLSDASLRFYQKSSIARALCLHKDKLGEWTLMHAINALRNTLAHKLQSEEREKRVARVRRTYFKEAPDGSDIATLTEASDSAVIAAACAHCARFLYTLESDERALRPAIHALDRRLNPDQPEPEL
jgi:hypothetical protein